MQRVLPLDDAQDLVDGIDRFGLTSHHSIGGSPTGIDFPRIHHVRQKNRRRLTAGATVAGRGVAPRAHLRAHERQALRGGRRTQRGAWCGIAAFCVIKWRS